MADTLPKFRNVRTLSIDGCNLKTKANIQALDSLFLQNVPGLTKLNLQDCEVLLLYMLHVQYNIL
jgi:hypothetical protein